MMIISRMQICRFIDTVNVFLQISRYAAITYAEVRLRRIYYTKLQILVTVIAYATYLLLYTVSQISSHRLTLCNFVKY